MRARATFLNSGSPLPVSGFRSPIFSWPTRVYWEDTDAGGVVYHAQYVAFLERARTEWLRAHGHEQERMRNDYDMVFAVRDMQLEFLRPARLDDLLSVTAELSRCRRASIVFTQSVLRGEEVLVTAKVRAAVLSASTFRPKAAPDALYEQMKALQISDTEHQK